MDVVNKETVITLVSDRLDMTKKDTRAVLDAVLDVITESVAHDATVQLGRFGRFSSRIRPASVCRNPRNGETVNVPERRQIAFKASKSTKDTVRGA